MATVAEIKDEIHKMAPFSTAMSFDNVGILVGDPQQNVTRVLLALDVTRSVVEEACALGAELIISHHPVIFTPLKQLTANSIPYRLAQKGIAVISAHTNYDLAPKGVNFCLAKALRLSNLEPFQFDEKTGLALGLVGDLSADPDLSPQAFAQYVKEKLHCGGVKYTQGDRSIRKVAVGCGASSDLIFDAIGCGADAFVTGESKHHELLAAAEHGITMVDAGHFNTEDVAMEPLGKILQNAFPTIRFEKSALREPVSYL